MYFITPFFHTLLLYPCFTSQMALLGFYHVSSLFTSAVTSIHARAYGNRYCGRESAHGSGTWEFRSTVNFGRVRVQTPASCIAGECFFHHAMSLSKSLYFFPRVHREIWPNQHSSVPSVIIDGSCRSTFPLYEVLTDIKWRKYSWLQLNKGKWNKFSGKKVKNWRLGNFINRKVFRGVGEGGAKLLTPWPRFATFPKIYAF